MAQLELSVVLNLANFRTQLGKLAQASAAYYYPINLTINKQAFRKQLAALGNIKPVIKIEDSQLDGARTRIATLNKSLATLRRATSTPIEIKLKYVEVGKPPSAAAGQIGRAVSGRIRADEAVAGLDQRQAVAARNMLKAANVPVSGLGTGRSLGAYQKSIVEGMTKAGDQAIAGLTAGLKDGKSEVAQAAKLVGESGLRALKDFWGIASPSRVFNQIGEFAVDGLELGFLNGLKDFKNKSVNEVRKITALLKFELAKVSNMSGMGGPSMGSLRRQLVGQRAYTSPIGPQPLGSKTPWAAGSAGQFGSSGYEPRMVSRPYGQAYPAAPGSFLQFSRSAGQSQGGGAPPPVSTPGSFLGFSQRATQVTQIAQRQGGGSFPSDNMMGRSSAVGGPSTPLSLDYYNRAFGNTNAVKIADQALQSVNNSQSSLIGSVKSLAGEFGEATKQVLIYGAAYKGLAFIASLPGQILSAVKNQQQFNNAMQVATQTSGSYAKELLFVDNVQRAFGLDLDTTRSGFTRLYASMSPAGFDSGSIEKLFVGISSAMASLQLTPDKAERVIYAFGQMASKGQVMSEELKGQLGDVLPGALAIFASAAGKSVKEFNKEIEDGVYSGAKFRDLMSKVTEELITRFGSGASAAARSLQGLMNVVKGDFTRLLESFAPLANSAAEAILKPLGGALRQLSVATKLATGERGRLGGQVTKQEKVVQELGAVAAVERGGPNEAKSLEQYKGAKQSLAALNIELDNLNELAKDPAIAQQAEDIKAFANEIGKAGNFVKNFAMAIGGTLSPILNFLGTNLTAIIGTIASLTFAFQGARLALLAFAGVMTVVKGVLVAVGFLGLVQQVGSFSAALATSGGVAKAVAAIFTSLGLQATAAAGSTARSWAVAGTAITFASGATITLTTAMVALAAVTGLGIIAAIGLLGAAFSAMGQDAKQAAEDSKQAAKDIAEAARKGNVPQVEAGIREANAKAQLLEDTQGIVNKRSTPGKKSPALSLNSILGDRLLLNEAPRLSASNLSDDEKNTLAYFGIVLPKEGALKSEVDKLLNAQRAALKQGRKNAPAELALAKKQAALTGQAIPDLGLKGAQPVEDPNAEKAAQRGKALLDAIEQREEAIAKAREQREEDIAKARKDAIENAKKLEESLAKQRIQIEREVAKTRRDIAAVQQNIGFVSASISASLTGGDTDLVRIEQEITEAARKRNEDRITLEQQLADQQTERTKSIEALKKTTADAINEANVRYAKAIGDAQREYAKASTKIIEEGTNRAGKRLEAAAKLAGALIEQSSALSAYTSGTGRSVRVAGPNSFAVGRGQSATADEFRKTNKALELLGIAGAAEILGEAVINTTTAVDEAERALSKLSSAATSSGSAIQQISVNTADLTRNVQAANRAITGVGNTLRTENNKLGGQQFFLEYQKQIEKAVQGLGQARQSAEDEVKKTRGVLAARRQGLTGDQAESLYNAELLRLDALAEAQKAYDTQLSKTPPEEQQALTDDFEQRTIQIEGAFQALVRFNDALYNMPTELKLSVAIVEAQDRLRDLLDPVEQIKGAASSIGDAFGTAFKGIITGSMTAREALAGFFQGIADYFADMVAQMIAAWLKAQLIQGFQSLFRAVLPGLGAAAGGLSSGFSAGTSSAIDTGAAGWASSFATPLKFANGGIAPGGFQAFANGGVVSGPTLGLVGEGRYNEAVIPLPDGKSVPVDLGGMAGGMGGEVTSNIVVNINNGQMQGNGNGNGSELGRKLEGAVKQVLVSELRPGGILSSGRR